MTYFVSASPKYEILYISVIHDLLRLLYVGNVKCFHMIDVSRTRYVWNPISCQANLIIFRMETPVPRVNQNPSRCFADEANTIPIMLHLFAAFQKQVLLTAPKCCFKKQNVILKPF